MELNPYDLQREADEQRIQFLRHEVEMSNTLCDLAQTEFSAGQRETGERSLKDARKGYSTIVRFLTDPKHAAHIGAQDREWFERQLGDLKVRLDSFKK